MSEILFANTLEVHPTVARRYAALVDALPQQVVWIANAAGEIIDDSPGLRRITGATIEQSIGRRWMSLLHDDEVTAAEREWNRVTAERSAYAREHRVRTRGGESRWFAVHAVPVVEDGKIVEWVGTFRDIDARKMLVNAATRVAASLDETDVVDAVLHAAVPALADWCAIDFATDRGRVVAHMSRLASCERSIVPADASIAEIAERASARLIFSADMQVRGVRIGELHLGSIARTVTFDDDKHQLAHELSRLAAAALDNARLFAAAEQANRARDVFLATLSHEMKTPITAILGWARMLKAEGSSSDLFEEALGAIEQSARVQERLIEDLLDVSRVITGKLHIEKQRVRLRNVITAAVDMVTPAARQSGVHLRVRADADVTVHGDETRLRQIIWNLLTNAVKFTPAGGFVEIEMARVDNRDVRISVRDSGRGIKADTLPYLFDQFHQNTVADRAHHRGLGLGLSIVRHLAIAHGGTVGARSEGEGKGSEFEVTLPLARSE